MRTETLMPQGARLPEEIRILACTLGDTFPHFGHTTFLGDLRTVPFSLLLSDVQKVMADSKTLNVAEQVTVCYFHTH